MLNIEEAYAYFKTHEGVVDHMYLDIVGLVTIGVGFLVPTAEDAERLDLVNRETRQPATAPEKRRDWEEVLKQPKARLAKTYRKFTRLDMTEAAINAEFERRISAFLQSLRKRFTGFDRFPARVQIGLLDMTYSLGPKGLFAGFPRFCAAVDARDWNTCAAECDRGGVSDTRNTACRQLFLEASRSGVAALESAPAARSATPRRKNRV